MDPDELEALIGRLGRRRVGGLGNTVERLVVLGPSVFPSLLRVLEDPKYRLALWERYGKAHEGEPVYVGGSPERPLNSMRYDQVLRMNAVYALKQRRESKAQPLAAILRVAADQAFEEEYPDGRPNRPYPDSEQRRWVAYLDACAALNLDGIRAFWQGRGEDKNSADAGIGSAFSDDSPGVSARLAETLEFLLDKGGDIDVELHPNIGHVALQYAAQDDDPERVTWLLAHGADVNGADYDGCTALMFALRGDGLVGPRDMVSRRAVLRRLLEAGADPTYQKRKQYEDFESVGPTLWEFADAEGEALLSEFGVTRPPEGGAYAAE